MIVIVCKTFCPGVEYRKLIFSAYPQQRLQAGIIDVCSWCGISEEGCTRSGIVEEIIGKFFLFEIIFPQRILPGTYPCVTFSIIVKKRKPKIFIQQIHVMAFPVKK